MTKITTPVVLFTFNRPDNLRAQIEAIGNLSFSKMYFVSDGPRNDNDLILIKECRELYNSFKNIDIKIEYANENNWGCKRNFFFHLDKIFQLEEKIIVLEARLFYGIDLYHSGDNTIPIISKDKRNAAKAEAESCPDAEIHLDDDD